MLEDNPHDAMFIKRTLQRTGFEFDSKIVACKEDFIAALDEFVPDIILSDHQLPQFSSTEGLEICRKKIPFIPFILVTGAVSEEFAASIIREGADDYLLKGNLMRLPTAIRQAIKKNETEKSLIQSKERYDLVSKATSDAIWDWDIVKGTVFWNHGVKTLFGFDPLSSVGIETLWNERIHPHDRDRVIGEINKVFGVEENSWISSYRYKHADGHYCHVFDRAHILYEQGKPVRMIGAMQDISEQVKTLEEVKRLSIVASKTDNSVLILDNELRIEWVNAGFTRLSGYTLAEVEGKKPFEFLHGLETDPIVTARIKGAATLQRPCSEEILNYSKDGRKYWVRITVTPVFNEKKTLDKFVTIQSDITEQKEFEKSISAVASELTSLIENANAPIFGVDKAGNINEWNKVTGELTGYEKEEVFKKHWTDFMDTKIHLSILDVLAKVLTGKSVRNYELPFVRRNGSLLMLLVSFSPRLDVKQNIKPG